MGIGGWRLEIGDWGLGIGDWGVGGGEGREVLGREWHEGAKRWRDKVRNEWSDERE